MVADLSKRYGQRHFCNGFRARKRGEERRDFSTDWRDGWDMADALYAVRSSLIRINLLAGNDPLIMEEMRQSIASIDAVVGDGP